MLKKSSNAHFHGKRQIKERASLHNFLEEISPEMIRIVSAQDERKLCLPYPPSLVWELKWMLKMSPKKGSLAKSSRNWDRVGGK